MNTISAARPNFGGQIQPRFGAHYNVLAVDDDMMIRMPILKRFQNLGRQADAKDTFTVSVAVNAEEAIAQLNESTKNPADRFDIVITDNSMPDKGDGMRVLKHIQKMTTGKPWHTFMYSSDDVREQALRLGAEEFFDKNVIRPANKLVDLIMARLQQARPALPKRAQSSPVLTSAITETEGGGSPTQFTIPPQVAEPESPTQNQGH